MNWPELGVRRDPPGGVAYEQQLCNLIKYNFRIAGPSAIYQEAHSLRFTCDLAETC